MKYLAILPAIALVLACALQLAMAFVPSTHVSSIPGVKQQQKQQRCNTNVFGFMGDKERDALTRDSEPDQYFQTNTDKMTDAQKLPIALAGVAFITVPFIAGLIALYAAK